MKLRQVRFGPDDFYVRVPVTLNFSHSEIKFIYDVCPKVRTKVCLGNATMSYTIDFNNLIYRTYRMLTN